MKYIFKISIAILLSLCSCDEVFDYKFNVINLTDKEILIIYYTGNLTNNYWDTVSIEQNKHMQIYVEHSAGGRELKGVDVSIIFDSFIVKKDNIQSNINFRKNENWEYREITDNLGEYTLTVDSSHFEYK